MAFFRDARLSVRSSQNLETSGRHCWMSASDACPRISLRGKSLISQEVNSELLHVSNGSHTIMGIEFKIGRGCVCMAHQSTGSGKRQQITWVGQQREQEETGTQGQWAPGKGGIHKLPPQLWVLQPNLCTSAKPQQICQIFHMFQGTTIRVHPCCIETLLL